MNARLHHLGGFALAFALSGVALRAADLLDAPGPGYREQAGQPRALPGGMHYRSDLLDALPRSRVRRLSPAQVELLFDRMRLRTGSARAVSERPSSGLVPILPAGTLPELPRTNPFDKPIRLFEQPAR